MCGGMGGTTVAGEAADSSFGPSGEAGQGLGRLPGLDPVGAPGF